MRRTVQAEDGVGLVSLREGGNGQWGVVSSMRLWWSKFRRSATRVTRGAREWAAFTVQRLFRGPNSSRRFETTQLEADACPQGASAL